MFLKGLVHPVEMNLSDYMSKGNYIQVIFSTGECEVYDLNRVLSIPLADGLEITHYGASFNKSGISCVLCTEGKTLQVVNKKSIVSVFRNDDGWAVLDSTPCPEDALMITVIAC